MLYEASCPVKLLLVMFGPGGGRLTIIFFVSGKVATMAVGASAVLAFRS